MIEKGNIIEGSKSYNGWFLGPFVDKVSPFSTAQVEMKWMHAKKGDIKPAKSKVENNYKTLDFIISGKYYVKFLETGEEMLCENEGDYILYQPNVPHYVEFLEDTSLITVRWI